MESVIDKTRRGNYSIGNLNRFKDYIGYVDPVLIEVAEQDVLNRFKIDLRQEYADDISEQHFDATFSYLESVVGLNDLDNFVIEFEYAIGG